MNDVIAVAVAVQRIVAVGVIVVALLIIHSTRASRSRWRHPEMATVVIAQGWALVAICFVVLVASFLLHG